MTAIKHHGEPVGQRGEQHLARVRVPRVGGGRDGAQGEAKGRSSSRMMVMMGLKKKTFFAAVDSFAVGWDRDYAVVKEREEKVHPLSRLGGCERVPPGNSA